MVKVHIVFAENDEDIYVPVAVFDNEAAAQHRANALCDSCVMPFEIEHEDTAPEIVELKWEDGEISTCLPIFNDDLYKYKNKFELQVFNIGVWNSFYCDISFLVDKALLVGDWEERFDVYCQTIVKQGKQVFADRKDWWEVRQILLDKIKADLQPKEEKS